MDNWQKTAVIISILTFLRLVYKDISEYIASRKKKRKKKKAPTSRNRRKR